MDLPADCLHCGVCCFSKSGTYIRVSESDLLRLGEDGDRLVRSVGGQSYMRMEDGHCAAMAITTRRGEAPSFFCTVYERRPTVCRDLARGGQACATEMRAKADSVASRFGR